MNEEAQKQERAELEVANQKKVSKTYAPKQTKHQETVKVFEANTNTDAKEKHSDLANEKKQKFKKIYASIHKDIAQQTTEFLEFAEANGAFDWQAGKIPTSDY